ncbi:MAG TPA: multiheme c-type cytochrome [Anaerolineae bacterium]|nr:multiheme c-type cytochrome [Anaerolineae bacterium]
MRRRTVLIVFTLAVLLLLGYVEAQAQEPGYVGSEKCAQCHGAKYESYRDTWHARFLRPASDESVVGDFSSTDPALTFSREDVVYALGGQFSQRYLTELNGELYVLPAQWNVVDEQWVAYHPDDWQERPYAQFCAGCHTTGFNAETGEWLEDGIQCEACHGPGLDHVALAGDTAHIVNPALLNFDEQTEICGQCHLRGSDPSGEFEFPVDYRPGGPLPLDEAFIPTGDPDAFWPDGSSKRHHQEYQDWQLSGHAAGVACVFCHVSHSRGETLYQTRFVGDHRCVICHEEKKDVALHTPYHPPAELVCTDCHMPTLAQKATAEYNFEFHSHTFWPPNPAATIQYGGQEIMPNACNLCHSDQSPEWAAEAMSLDVEEVAFVPTLAPVASPTAVPTATPFLDLEEEEAAEEQPGNGNLPLMFAVGLGFLAVLVVIILVVQRRDRGEGREV